MVIHNYYYSKVLNLSNLAPGHIVVYWYSVSGTFHDDSRSVVVLVSPFWLVMTSMASASECSRAFRRSSATDELRCSWAGEANWWEVTGGGGEWGAGWGDDATVVGVRWCGAWTAGCGWLWWWWGPGWGPGRGGQQAHIPRPASGYTNNMVSLRN